MADMRDWGDMYVPPGEDDYQWLIDMMGGGDGPGDDYSGSYPSTGEVTQGDLGITNSPDDTNDNIDIGGGFNPGSTELYSGIERALGIATGGLKNFLTTTGLSLRDVLGLAAGVGGTLYGNKMSKEGVEAIQKATGESKDLATKALATVSGNYKPYMDTGVKSNADLYAMVGNNNLFGKYNANAPAFNQVKPYADPVTLADLAKYRR